MGEQTILAVARMVTTYIVAPLGIVATAANAFAITAESLCYMPAYGVQAAASTLVGQSVGAGRRDMTYRLGWLTVALGMGLMAVTGTLLYLLAPVMMGMMSADAAVIALGSGAADRGVCGAAVRRVHRGQRRISGRWRYADADAPEFRHDVGRSSAAGGAAGKRAWSAGVWIAMALRLILCGACFLICLWRRRWLPWEAQR